MRGNPADLVRREEEIKKSLFRSDVLAWRFEGRPGDGSAGTI